jgi:hypothetical protein
LSSMRVSLAPPEPTCSTDHAEAGIIRFGLFGGPPTKAYNCISSARSLNSGD